MKFRGQSGFRYSRDMAEIFSANERSVLDYLHEHYSGDLATIAKGCDLARSSTYTAIKRLADLGILENTARQGKAKFQIAARDQLESAAKNLLADFKQAVLPPNRPKAKPVLVFADNYRLPDEQLRALGRTYNVRTFETTPITQSAAAFQERCRGAQVIVRYDTQPIDRDFLVRNPTLQAVVIPSCVVENVDFSACAEFGVDVFFPDATTHKYYTNSQLEYVANALLTLVKPLRSDVERLDDPDAFYDWTSRLHKDIYGMKVGLLFHIGTVRPLVQMLQVFGCEVSVSCTAEAPPLISDLGVSAYRSFDALWSTCDALVILDGTPIDLEASLVSETSPDFLISESSLATFSPHSLRSAVLDARLRGVALDALPSEWRCEVSRERFQEMVRPLRDLPNVILTAEAGVFTFDAIDRSHERVFSILNALAV